MAILGVIGLIVIGVMLMNKDRFSTPETWVKYVQYMPTFDECYRNAQGFGATHATAYKICREGIGFALRQ